MNDDLGLMCQCCKQRTLMILYGETSGQVCRHCQYLHIPFRPLISLSTLHTFILLDLPFVSLFGYPGLRFFVRLISLYTLNSLSLSRGYDLPSISKQSGGIRAPESKSKHKYDTLFVLLHCIALTIVSHIPGGPIDSDR